MTNYAREPSGRIDTNHTLVSVRRGDDRAASTAAASYVKKEFPDADVKILSVRLNGERDSAGNPVYDVEWEDGSEAEE